MPTIDELDQGYARLPGPAAALYRLIGATPVTWFDSDALAVLTGLPAPASDQLAELLVGAGMLAALDGGIAPCPAARVHARVLSEESHEQEINAESIDRLYTYYTDAAAAAEALITPSHRPIGERQPASDRAPFPPVEPAVLNWLEHRLPSYMNILRAAFAEQRYGLVVELAHRLWPLWLRRRQPVERREALTLGLAAAYLSRSDAAIAQMLTALAGAVRGTDPWLAYDHDRRAAGIFSEIGDSLGFAQALNGIGKTFSSIGDLPRAEVYLRDAEQLRTDAGYMRGAALSRQGRGMIAFLRGEVSRAADLLDSAYRDLLAEGDHYDAALSLAHHARAMAELGDLTGALRELDTAADILRTASSAYGEASVWQIRALILDEHGSTEQAQQAHERATVLAEHAGESPYLMRLDPAI